jgi:tRNA A37 threonylcarbamoyladenosine modification protein TsaB
MILGLKTNERMAEIWVDGVRHEWESGREMAQKLLGKVVELLPDGDVNKISRIVLYQGEGSFTGLRIGATIANMLADSLDIPIVGASGTDWYSDGVSRLERGENEKQVLPEYGRGANITKRRK